MNPAQKKELEKKGITSEDVENINKWIIPHYSHNISGFITNFKILIEEMGVTSALKKIYELQNMTQREINNPDEDVTPRNSLGGAQKTKRNKRNKSIKRKTNKQRSKRLKKRNKILVISNKTPSNINQLSKEIDVYLNSLDENIIDLSISSYSPSINQKLITLVSGERDPIVECNNKAAFSYKEPLKISFKNKCYPYYTNEAKTILLNNLATNKHINPSKILTPIQSLGNCWFNTMFVTLFVSDKGRKFFHFFRQLMIDGIQSNGREIPKDLKNGLALFNYAIELCLTGNKILYKLDTNIIIKNIYDNIPEEYKRKLHFITNIKDAGNPIRYYGSLMYYLNNTSINMSFISGASENWKTQIHDSIHKSIKNPHIIILEIFDDASKAISNKPLEFVTNGNKYMLDSCVIRNTKGHHFSALLTCEKREMAYDGMSFHHLVPIEWKKYINVDKTWEYAGVIEKDETPYKWNFMSGYQMLIYYKV